MGLVPLHAAPTALPDGLVHSCRHHDKGSGENERKEPRWDEPRLPLESLLQVQQRGRADEGRPLDPVDEILNGVVADCMNQGPAHMITRTVDIGSRRPIEPCVEEPSLGEPTRKQARRELVKGAFDAEGCVLAANTASHSQPRRHAGHDVLDRAPAPHSPLEKLDAGGESGSSTHLSGFRQPPRASRWDSGEFRLARRLQGSMRWEGLDMRIFLSAAAIAALAACATPGEKTAIGAGGGAAGGALIGGLAGGWEGAAIGAVAGGVLGGAIGNYLDKQDQELKRFAETRRTENGILVNLRSSLLFSKDSAVVRPETVDQLVQLGDILARYPDDRIRIVGYTDSTGSAAYDESLSLRRAQAVRDILASRGVNPRQMLAEGAGATRPDADNATEEGRAQNRRVELYIDVPQRS